MSNEQKNSVINVCFCFDDNYAKYTGVTVASILSNSKADENIHFLRNKITPWQLGWKSAMVNISDICASGAEPKYLTIALSLPKDIDKSFIEEFYAGVILTIIIYII